MNGTHRQHGVLLLHGAGIAEGVEVEASMPDIAPTLLHLLGESIPDHMDGRVLSDALSVRRPVMRSASEAFGSSGSSASSKESAAIRKRLERLGYL
jgi:arylsulfatase A-like enzyme